MGDDEGGMVVVVVNVVDGQGKNRCLREQGYLCSPRLSFSPSLSLSLPPRSLVAMLRFPTLVSLLALALPHVARADPCVVFDASFNLYAFGLNGKDWNAGTQDAWASGTSLSALPIFISNNICRYCSGCHHLWSPVSSLRFLVLCDSH